MARTKTEKVDHSKSKGKNNKIGTLCILCCKYQLNVRRSASVVKKEHEQKVYSIAN